MKGPEMTITQSPVETDTYALGRTAQEYERLRAQARVWEVACLRVLDQVGLTTGARCLDAGCGPGETMRLMAQRVGPTGEVVGLDVDAALGGLARQMLHEAGHLQCSFEAHDVAGDRPIPGAPFDLVYARLLIFHLPQRLAVLRRLWEAVAPSGHLVVQEYDLRTTSVVPQLASVAEAMRVVNGAFDAFGADVQVGARMPDLFAEAGIGAPDGTDVTGRIDPLGVGRAVLEQTLRSVLPGALAHGVTTEDQATATLTALDHDATTYAQRPMLWPLMIATWKRKDAA
jgi:trans-aconitate methyltransferase